MKILLNIFSAIISYLLFILSFCGFFLFSLSIIDKTSDSTSTLFVVILWAFFIWITFSILYSFQKRIRDYIDSNYMVSFGMIFDLVIYFTVFPLAQEGVILFPETDSITLLIIICISIIILLYAMGILIMKNIYSKYRKKYPIQLDNTEKILKD
ncbi:hypothetical protein [uncultured Eubacterium sp.]|uniref:hypothetical protein n=1 Tax=uncultured Eubacterium sp. TaxID=165185 RepID=UPI002593C62F|nr:hypothetical protein [uncultured Eubacterium sp.]